MNKCLKRGLFGILLKGVYKSALKGAVLNWMYQNWQEDFTFPCAAVSIKTLRKSLLALKTLHNSLTFPAPYLRSKHLCKEFPLFFCELATETYGRLLSWRTNLMWRRSVYDCFSDSPQNGCHHGHSSPQTRIKIQSLDLNLFVEHK